MGKKVIAALLFVVTVCTAVVWTDSDYGNPVSAKELVEENKKNNEDKNRMEKNGENTSKTDENKTTTGVVDIQAPSAILMEASTGTVIYDKDSKKQLRPASITKIMTLILIFDALESGQIKLEDEVITSEYASSMGGSQVFLEMGEKQTVDTLIKCIAVASANDGCVAMAEHICGSEEAFVAKMNERAKGLGMKQTHFVNCCGLDVDGHVTSAMDVAIMSRELITKYPQIHDYSTIWMENITHTTAKGSKEFGLANTNKLIKQYSYATGLKTGSTSLAKYCVSATAKKDGVNLIAVVMAAPDYKVRFKDAKTLLEYGFANCKVYTDTDTPKFQKIKVDGSLKNQIEVGCQGDFSYLSMNGENLDAVEKKLVIPKQLQAPVKKGAVIGKVEYILNGKKIGENAVVAKENADKAGFFQYYNSVWKMWTL